MTTRMIYNYHKYHVLFFNIGDNNLEVPLNQFIHSVKIRETEYNMAITSDMSQEERRLNWDREFS